MFKMLQIEYESPVLPLIACFLLSILFVGSLYVWDSKYDRNHPETIKKRFFSVFMVILISPFVFKFFIILNKFKSFSILELMGFRLSGIFFAATIPLTLTAILFLGPLCMIDATVWWSFLDYKFWLANSINLIWIRNVIVGPLAEEFTFRACMLPMLLQCFDSSQAILVCSLFFGLAHTHHAVERFRAGDPYNILIIKAIIEFSYTTLFGAYSALIFYKTGHFLASFVIHAFCNIMGFPDFHRVLSYKNPKKSLIIFVFISGMLFWYILLDSFLNHELYNNYVFF